jgi:Leucine carboxyl methyltransferase
MHGKRAEQDGDVCGRVAWLFRLETASPWVLDDVLALVLVGPVWQQLRDQFDPLFPGPGRREARAAVCTRSRYAEDRLAAGVFGQYVILGAGLDSFAWRRPDLLGSLTVFEVDHPASQAITPLCRDPASRGPAAAHGGEQRSWGNPRTYPSV